MKRLIYFIAIIAMFASCTSEKKDNNNSKSNEKKKIQKDTISGNEEKKDDTEKYAKEFQKFLLNIKEVDYDPGYNMNFYDKKDYISVPDTINHLFALNEAKMHNNYSVSTKITVNENLYILSVYTYKSKYIKQAYISLFTFTKEGKCIEKKTVASIDENIVQTGFLFKEDLKLTTSTINLENKNAKPEIEKYQIDGNGKFIEQKLPVTDEEKIADVISEDDLKYVKEAVKLYNNIKSSKDIANLLNNKITKIVSIAREAINRIRPYVEYSEDVKYFEKHIPLITLVGTDGGVSVEENYYNLYKKALETPEKDDDVFFEALSNGEKPQEFDGKFNFRTFSPSECSDMETCYSLLGGGKCYGNLSKIQKALETETNFKKSLEQLKTKLIDELIFYSKFAYSKKEVLSFQKKIIDNITLNKDESVKLKKIENAINKAKDTDFNYRNK